MLRMLQIDHFHPGIILLLIWLCHFMEVQKVQAGNCWMKQGKNNKCLDIYTHGMSREDCCKTGRLGYSWTEEDVPNSTLFRWKIFNGGAPNCIPCKETCDNVDCGPGKRCKMNKRSKPRCVCAPDCSVTWKEPVCGSDGKTYKDECALLKFKCKGHPDLNVQYLGKCKKSCRGVKCFGSATCVVDQTNSAYCVHCNTVCAEVTSPDQYLCGNDGIIYASTCHLRRATCFLGRSIGIAYLGKCIKAKSCKDIQCSAGKRCLWDSRMSRGRCSLCDEVCPGSRPEEAVCASDNTTYPSECAMKQAACSLGMLLEVKHSGSCNSITEDQEEDEEDEDPDYMAFIRLSSLLDG
ncbi:follistatin-A [Osmerus mordax]|uniref:follistatin-A n=1 Tax=Osmerus mordax TaxID=8014 RepID=UPI00350F684A